MCRKYSRVHFKPIYQDFHWMPGSSCPPKKQRTILFFHATVWFIDLVMSPQIFFYFFQAKYSRLFNCFLDRNHSISLVFLVFFSPFWSSIVPVFVLRYLAALLVMHQRLICNSRMRHLLSI